MGIDELIEMVSKGGSAGWVAAAALIVGAVVRLLKTEKIAVWQRVPQKFRPLVVMALGAVAAALDMAVRGTPPRDAITHGFLAFALAVSGHETLIRGLREGREVGQKKVNP